MFLLVWVITYIESNHYNSGEKIGQKANASM